MWCCSSQAIKFARVTCHIILAAWPPHRWRKKLNSLSEPLRPPTFSPSAPVLGIWKILYSIVGLALFPFWPNFGQSDSIRGVEEKTFFNNNKIKDPSTSVLFFSKICPFKKAIFSTGRLRRRLIIPGWEENMFFLYNLFSFLNKKNIGFQPNPEPWRLKQRFLGTGQGWGFLPFHFDLCRARTKKKHRITAVKEKAAKAKNKATDPTTRSS